jgi:predicted nucleic acid-binding protein
MLVVSDTSPISNLAVIGQLRLLRERYGRVVIPPKVLEELNRLSHPEGSQEIENALSDGWLVVEPLPDETWLRKLEERVDPGEAAAICLAESIQADKLLVDDRQGRELARERGIKVAGLLGELVHAKLQGRLTSVLSEMTKLQTEARFFIRDDIRAFILAQAGE